MLAMFLLELNGVDPNGCPLEILLCVFKLASLNSFESKNSFEL